MGDFSAKAAPSRHALGFARRDHLEGRGGRTVAAKAAPITVGGQKAYGVYIAPGTGYRNNNTNGVATGDQPEGIYAVLDGTHYNGGCCFDYGNAQTNNLADSPAIMETVYFGNSRQWGYGACNGHGSWPTWNGDCSPV